MERVTRAVLAAQLLGQGGGTIVNIASTLAWVRCHGCGYSAAKAACCRSRTVPLRRGVLGRGVRGPRRCVRDRTHTRTAVSRMPVSWGPRVCHAPIVRSAAGARVPHCAPPRVDVVLSSPACLGPLLNSPHRDCRRMAPWCVASRIMLRHRVGRPVRRALRLRLETPHSQHATHAHHFLVNLSVVLGVAAVIAPLSSGCASRRARVSPRGASSAPHELPLSATRHGITLSESGYPAHVLARLSSSASGSCCAGARRPRRSDPVRLLLWLGYVVGHCVGWTSLESCVRGRGSSRSRARTSSCKAFEEQGIRGGWRTSCSASHAEELSRFISRRADDDLPGGDRDAAELASTTGRSAFLAVVGRRAASRRARRRPEPSSVRPTERYGRAGVGLCFARRSFGATRRRLLGRASAPSSRRARLVRESGLRAAPSSILVLPVRDDRSRRSSSWRAG
jgi:hypothetical protein